MKTDKLQIISDISIYRYISEIDISDIYFKLPSVQYITGQCWLVGEMYVCVAVRVF